MVVNVNPAASRLLSETEWPDRDSLDLALISAIQAGLPLCPYPYAEIGKRIGMDEAEVILRLERMQEKKLIKRMGVVVRHRELGYRANAMVVWDIPDEQIQMSGRCISQLQFVTLCYQRPRRLPDWRYNLFCMIHGKNRTEVLTKIEFLKQQCALEKIPNQVLFSRRCFKQRGARYVCEPNTKDCSHGQN